MEPLTVGAGAAAEPPAESASSEVRVAEDGGTVPDRPLISIVVPAFNEEGHLRASLTAIMAAAESLSDQFQYELVVVDDGSSDQTGDVIREFAESHDAVVVLFHPRNFGLGQALKTGFGACRGQYIIAYDADLSYDPSHICRLAETIHGSGADVVIASPYMTGGTVVGVPRLRRVLSQTANRLLRRMSNSHVSTVTSLVRAYRASLIQSLSLKSTDNQINAEILYKAEMMRSFIVEIPADLHWTRDEVDTNRRRGNMSIIRTTIDFAFSGFIFRPFLLFVVPGVILMFLALYALGWAGYHVIRLIPRQTGNLDQIISDAFGQAFVHSPHSFVLGGFAAIFAVQLISVGIISAQSKRYFEDAYHLATANLGRLQALADSISDLKPPSAPEVERLSRLD
ncbi:MAG: glycosyltransferase family 2 protein [Acidimicrobiia bacterium]